MSKALYLVDGYSLIYRSYFAFMKRPLFNPQGENSSAVFGFFRALFQLLKQRNPARLAIIMDSRTPTFRHLRFPAYKANREKAPADLHAQVPVIEEICEALGIACFRKDGFEADDLIATLAGLCKKEERECYILSGDKDILQSVGEGVFVLTAPKGGGEYETLDSEEVFNARGIYPGQVVDYLALAGDQSDNVPGVPGVGDKTALKLLSQYHDLDAIYANLASVIPDGLREKLARGRESAFLSRELVRLRKDVPMERDLDSFNIETLNTSGAIPLFAAQGMKSLVEGLGGRIEEEASFKELTAGAFETVLDEISLNRWLTGAKKNKVFAFDTETDSLDPLAANPVGFSLALGEGEACYIPVKARDVDVLPAETVRKALKTLLEDPALMLVGQNIKYDYKVMKGWGITVRNRLFDTMVAAWVLDSELSSYSLDNLALKILGYKTIHYGDVVGKDQDLTLADVEIGRVSDYAAEDAEIAFRLYLAFSGPLEQQGLDRLFYRLEMPLVTILAEMEIAGIKLEPDQLKAYSRELGKQLTEIEEEIFSRHGRSFNIRSTKELQQVLFTERRLKPIKKTKTGYSTDTGVLEELAREDEVPGLVLRHRLLSKLKSTYVEALPGLINASTGRLHTNYIQTGAATGRLASKDPNLQNIPIREEPGRRIRSAFIPEEGYSFLSADYSQIELAVLAHLSGDPMLLNAFREGIDIHRQTAGIIFDIPPEEVSSSQRRIGKTINFGVIYGMSAFRLARDLRIGRREAGDFISRYFQRYSGVERFIKDTIREAEGRGYVETIMGRRRKVTRIRSANRTEKMAAERVAVNSRIQGSAADIVKQAMIDVAGLLEENRMGTRLLLQVHDELIFEVPNPEMERARGVIKAAMENAVKLSLPLKVNLESGSSWGDIH